MHEIRLSDTVIARAKARRGNPHPFGDFEPARTALLVVDMQNGFVDPALSTSVPVAREIVPNINRIAGALRAAGGAVVWIQMAVSPDKQPGWSNWFDGFTSPELRAALFDNLTKGTPGFELWPVLETADGDLTVVKDRFSAFIQGSSDIGAVLDARGLDTVLVTGTVTNVCCESTARDAAMLNYRVVMVSDANAARSDEDHNATLNNLFNIFTDVQSTDQVVARLEAAVPARRTA